MRIERAEDGSVPTKALERKLLKQNARDVALTFARGWQEEADRLQELRERWAKTLDELPAKEKKKVEPNARKIMAALDQGELEAWVYVLLFALTLTPKDRNPFKRRAYNRFLKDNTLSQHLAPGVDVKLAWSGESEKELRKLMKRAFAIRKPKQPQGKGSRTEIVAV